MPPYRVFLDRFVPLETLQIVRTRAAEPRNRVSLLTNGFIEG
jgi:hypothetical protein